MEGYGSLLVAQQLYTQCCSLSASWLSHFSQTQTAANNKTDADNEEKDVQETAKRQVANLETMITLGAQ